MLQAPTLRKAGLFHVGTLAIGNKKAASFEGEGLSVSQCPDAWRAIARLAGDTWSISSREFVFLDAHRVSDDLLDSIFAWAVMEGFIAPTTLYGVRWFDDEMDGEMNTLFSDENEAEEEAEGFGVTVEIVPDYRTTEKFPDCTVKAGMNSIEFKDILLALYVRLMVPTLDGVWWEDVHDVNRYSAPRGVINRDCVKELSFTKV